MKELNFSEWQYAEDPDEEYFYSSSDDEGLTVYEDKFFVLDETEN